MSYYYVLLYYIIPFGDGPADADDDDCVALPRWPMAPRLPQTQKNTWGAAPRTAACAICQQRWWPVSRSSCVGRLDAATPTPAAAAATRRLRDLCHGHGQWHGQRRCQGRPSLGGWHSWRLPRWLPAVSTAARGIIAYRQLCQQSLLWGGAPTGFSTFNSARLS